MALIEFLHPSEAKVAFSKLAYRQYHDAPLYLEWAPTDSWNKSPSVQSNSLEKDDSEIEETSIISCFNKFILIFR